MLGVERDRIEEALDQADVLRVEVRIEAIDRLGEHRVAEAVDHVRELGDDRRIDRDVEAVGHHERVDLRLDLARELLEHQMLVLHLGRELGGLEQALAVPDQRAEVGRHGRHVLEQPLVEEGQVAAGCGGKDDFLVVLDHAVVLGMEDVVHGRQADVLVHAAVAGDEVGVEQFVVVLGVAVARVAQADGDVAVGDLADRHRVVRDVGQEGVAGAKRERRRRVDGGARRAGDDDVVGRVRNAVDADAGDDLREAGGDWE